MRRRCAHAIAWSAASMYGSDTATRDTLPTQHTVRVPHPAGSSGHTAPHLSQQQRRGQSSLDRCTAPSARLRVSRNRQRLYVNSYPQPMRPRNYQVDRAISAYLPRSLDGTGSVVRPRKWPVPNPGDRTRCLGDQNGPSTSGGAQIMQPRANLVNPTEGATHGGTAPEGTVARVRDRTGELVR
jgi:hypothetical protein